MAAEGVEGVGVWSLKHKDLSVIIMEWFEPQIKAPESETHYST